MSYINNEKYISTKHSFKPFNAVPLLGLPSGEGGSERVFILKRLTGHIGFYFVLNLILIALR